MSKIAAYFPGIGYHCDKPLLYNSRNIACELGYKNYRNVSCTYKAVLAAIDLIVLGMLRKESLSAYYDISHNSDI